MFDAQLGKSQPPIPNLSKAATTSYMHIGCLMCKTAGFPTGFGWNFGRFNGEKNLWAKVINFVPLEALSGPGAPDADLAPIRLGWQAMQA